MPPDPPLTSSRGSGLPVGGGSPGASMCALVVDPDPTLRSILAAQLRDLGVEQVQLCVRAVEARRLLETRSFDFILCEQRFPNEELTGQDLVDDLRRNQLLPYATVFVMITSEASYNKVAEAAESALDGYLVKPHKAAQLGERLLQARQRKLQLQDIFREIDAGNLAAAAALCEQRYTARQAYWLYAARIGAELWLRSGHAERARKIYESLLALKPYPWARLGVARSQIDLGQPDAALETLAQITTEDPAYADAYDVRGRALLDIGDFAQALETYRAASNLTPASIARLQTLGMMSYHKGLIDEARALLERAVRSGLGSRMFDCQNLVLLALMALQRDDVRTLHRCSTDLSYYRQRHAESARLQRFDELLQAMIHLAESRLELAMRVVRAACGRDLRSADFDLEAACNLLQLMAALAQRNYEIAELQPAVDEVAQRFGTTPGQTELLIHCSEWHPPFQERVRVAQTHTMDTLKQALMHSMAGDPTRAVSTLLEHGRVTLNAKIIETANMVLQTYAGKVADAPSLDAQVQELRQRYTTFSTRGAFGEHKRQAGGLMLRSGAGRSTQASNQG